MNYKVFFTNAHNEIDYESHDDSTMQPPLPGVILGYSNDYTKIVASSDLVSMSSETGFDHPVVFGDEEGLNPQVWFCSYQFWSVLRNYFSYSYAIDVIGCINEGEEFVWIGTTRNRLVAAHSGTRFYIGDQDIDDVMFQSTYNQSAYFINEDERDEYDEINKPQPQYLDDYHSGTLQVLRFDNETRFWVGLEIEKEDQDIRESLEIDEFKQRCPQWRKERDGSLDDSSGFELISPMMQLNIPEIIRHIKNSGTLTRHVNAEYGSDCGGHINLSDESRNAWELFDDIAGYVPLLCALYPSRVHVNYCQAKPKHRLVQENDKYQAIKIHRDRVEIRIFPAVRNLSTLEFRLKLVEFMLKNPAPSPKLVKLNRLRPILSMIYPGIIAPGTDGSTSSKPMLNETKFTALKQRIQTHTQNLK